MRSRAQFKGHPIHPMLIPLPIAFLAGGFAADLGGVLFGVDDLVVVAWYLVAAGVASAVLAAIPGVIDYHFTVPPQSSAKKRATRHMLTMVSAVALFSLAWVLRGGPGVFPDTVLVILEGVGALLLGVGGWMGGTLSFRNQIGVDHRYANAGKWKEAKLRPSSDWQRVSGSDELEIDQMKLLRVGEKRVVLARTADGWAAFADRCPHRGGSLAGGTVACGTVTCPWHGSQFEVRTGAVAAGPAKEGIATYPIEVRGSDIYLKVPAG